MESLRARQLELDQQQEDLEEKWRNAKCESTIPLSFPDWVRRLDVGDYPLVAVGSSSGNVYCANLETGESIAQSFGQEEEKPLTGHEELMRIMFAGYDGGGTLAIAMHKSLICSASRQGGIQLWRLDGQDTAELISQGTLQALQGVLVTCLELDGEYLWVGTADGRLQAYAHQSPDLPLALQTTPELEWNVGSAILSLSLNQEMNHGVISTAKGTVELFSLEDDGEIVAQWMPPLDSNERMSSNAYILSSTLIPYKEDGGYAIACGCNNGCIYLQPLNYENGIFVDDDKVLKTLRESEGQLNPRHLAAVKCLACPAPGVLLSGGQDGSLRVWNISEDDSHFLYQFVGYKVWLGTLWTDGARVVSDGADNSIIVHDFSAQQ
jgi:WD40 repeat protein